MKRDDSMKQVKRIEKMEKIPLETDTFHIEVSIDEGIYQIGRAHV